MTILRGGISAPGKVCYPQRATVLLGNREQDSHLAVRNYGVVETLDNIVGKIAFLSEKTEKGIQE